MNTQHTESMPKTKITFVDEGQDFLEWTIDSCGRIIDCQPAQFSVWKEWRVTNLEDLQKDEFVYIEKGSEQLFIIHPIENIEKISNK